VPVLHPLLLADCTCVFGVEERENVANCVEFVLLRGLVTSVLVWFGVEAVEETDFAGIPVAVGVKVVEDEEGGRIEVMDVVFLWKNELV
jgi:hypothetical protein